MSKEHKGPTRYQAKVWSDTVLASIVSGEWFEFEGIISHSQAPVANARQVGRYFPGFGGAFDTWMKNGNSFNEMILKQQAHEVISALPSGLDGFDLCLDLDAAEDCIARLEEENKKLREQVTAIVDTRVALSKDIARMDKLLSRSIRVDTVEFDDGEKGCRFILGEDHVVAEWRGDGVSIDTVFVEKPSLEYGVTTTAHIRCMRMILEMTHWEIICAMAAGAGNGELKEFAGLDDEHNFVDVTGDCKR